MRPLIKNLSDHTIKGKLLQAAATAILGTGLIILANTTAATQTVTIDGKIFQFYANAGDPTTVPAGRVPVELPASITGPNVITALKAKVQAEMDAGRLAGIQSLVSDNLVPGANTGRLLLIAKPEVASFAIATTGTGGSTSTTVSGGSDIRLTGNSRTFSHTVTAFEATAGTVFVALSFNPTAAIVQIRAADGSLVAWDGKYSFPNASNVLLLDNSGAVDWVAGAKILVTAIE